MIDVLNGFGQLDAKDCTASGKLGVVVTDIARLGSKAVAENRVRFDFWRKGKR